MKEFLGLGGYTRQAEGFLSWQHLTFVGFLLLSMVVLAYALGKQNQQKQEKTKNKVLVWSAFLIDGVEIFKIAILCVRQGNLEAILYNLPLFLCSVQLIAIPLAAFTNGRIKEAALDFVCIFGILGAVFGTIGAGQNYAAYPVLSLDNVASGITHSISGFASLYIMFSKMASLKRKNIWVTFGILSAFCVMAYIANITIDYNYMFLMAGDGTPYDILYNLVGGSPVFYPICVLALFILYIALFYFAVFNFKKRKNTKNIVDKAAEAKEAKVNI